jgi:hypothetical protein
MVINDTTEHKIKQTGELIGGELGEHISSIQSRMDSVTAERQ